jgi:membrane protein implicated in regulation of membrane protease activity
MKIEILYAVVFFVGSIGAVLVLTAPSEARSSDEGGRSIGGPVASVALAGFGAGGLFASLVLEAKTPGTLLAACLWLALLGALAWWGIRTIERADERESFDRAKLVGMTAIVSTGIPAGKVGQVTVQYAGMTRSLDASSDENIEREVKVVIDGVVGGELRVSRKITRPGEEILDDAGF